MQIDDFRSRRSFDMTTIKSFIDFTMEVKEQGEALYFLKVYDAFTSTTNKYYSYQQKQLMNTDNIYIYTHTAVDMVRLEQQLLLSCFDKITSEVIDSMLSRTFFYSCNKQVFYDFGTNFSVLLSKSNYSEVLTVYKTFLTHEPSLRMMMDIFKQHLRKEFTELQSFYWQMIVNKETYKCIVNETNFVEKMIDFYRDFKGKIESCFENNNLFLIALRETVGVLQEKEDKFNLSYLFPFYLDRYLNITSNVNEDFAKEAIKNFTFMFATLPDKDYFINIHTNLMTKRLVLHDCIDEMLEYQVIKEMREQFESN